MPWLALRGKSLDHGVIFWQTLDGKQVSAICLHRQQHTGKNGLTIHDNGACSACAFVTTNFQSGVTETFAQKHRKCGGWFEILPDLELAPFTINVDRNFFFQ